MPNKNFLLLSLDDSRTKKVANVVSNESCKKILDYLSNREATETELAEKLNIPISTVHYNLQQLTETGLIEAEEFHYSPKGREVNHYKLANKYIVIAPKSTWGIKEKLKGIFPVALIAAGAAGLIQLYTKYFSTTIITGQDQIAKPIAGESIAQAAPAVLEEAQLKAAESLPAAVSLSTPNLSTPNIALWFLVGALFALVVYLVISYIRKK